MLTTRDYKKVLDVIDTTYAVPDCAKMFQAVFEKLNKLIGISSAAYIPWNAGTNNFQFKGSVLFNCSAQALRVYLDQFSAIDPYIQSGSHLANPLNSAVKVTDFMTVSRYAETLYAREFAPLIPCFFEMNAMIGCRGGPTGGIALHRERREYDFMERDRKVMNLLLPHLAQAVHQIELMETIAAEQEGRLSFPEPTNGSDPFFFKTENDGFGKLLCEYTLTARQKEIATFVCRGFSNREIAGQLFICEQTVKDHLHDVFGKMKISRRSELTAKALGLCGGALKTDSVDEDSPS